MRLPRTISTTVAFIASLSAAQAPVKSGGPVVFGEAGTYPRATQLSDGSLLGIYTHFNGDNRTLTIVKSTDHSASSWNPIGSVDFAQNTVKDLDNGYLHQLPSGRILAAFRNHDRTDDPEVYAFYRITVCASDDGGKTWSFLSEPATKPRGPNGIWEPFLQTALDGSLQLYYSEENSNLDQDSILRRSTDGGKTWSNPQTISGKNIDNSRDGMLGVARINGPEDPEKLAIFEASITVPNTPFKIHTVRTTDDGKTWGDRALVHGPEGKSASSPQIIRVGRNRLVASFSTNEDGPGPEQQPAMKIKVSRDGGRTWSEKTTITDHANWTGMLALDDKSFLALYETGNTCRAQKMTF